jgi:chitosanase
VEQLEDRLVPSTFNPATSTPAGSAPQLLAVGHFNTNHDHHQGVVVTNQNGSYSVLLGNGNGDLTNVGTYDLPGATNTEGIVAGDFNGDGKDDLAIASYSGQVRILLGNGDGTFNLGATLSVPAGAGPTYLAAGDLNGDGKLDLVVADYNDNQLLVYQGDGAGGFDFKLAINDASVGQPTGIAGPDQVGLADFDGDGHLDVAVANQGNDSVTVLRGGGDFTFGQVVNIPVHTTAGGPAGPTGLAVGDFDGDGKPDLAVADYGNDANPGRTVNILRNTSSGGTLAFTGAQDVSVGNHLINVAAADFEDDGKLELAVTSAGNTNDPAAPADNRVFVLKNAVAAGGISFSSSDAETYTVGQDPVGLVTADLNEDGRLDLVNTNQNSNSVSGLLNRKLVVPPPPLETPPPTGSGADAASVGGLAPDQKLRADQLISLFENSTPVLQYSYVQNLHDGRGFTAGRAGFTTATGDLLDVVRRYTARKPRNPLRKYLPRLRQLAGQGSDSTAGLGRFVQAWRRAARDPLFRAVQDQVVDDTYYTPAVRRWQALGLRSALSLVVLYDTIIQQGEGTDPDGLPAVIDRATARAGGSPATGLGEGAWLTAFLQVRRETLQNAHDPATRAAWRQSVGRVDVLAGIAAQGNFDFHGPLAVTVYGDAFTLP